MVPLSGGGRADGFSVDGKPNPGQDYPTANLFMVTPGYFETMGIPRISGHDFGSESPTGPKTAIVNQTFVERFFPGRNPIGQHVTGGAVSYEIIGVVGNAKSRTLGEETRPVLYRSLGQTVASDPSIMGYAIIVHTAGNPAAMSESVRRQIHSLDLRHGHLQR